MECGSELVLGKGRNEAGLEWAELCPVVELRSVCLSGILL